MKTESNAYLIYRGLLAAALGGIVAPILWIVLTPVFDPRPDAVLFALGASVLLCIGAYAVTVSVFRRRSR